MNTVTTRAIVINETETSLLVLCEDAPQYTHKTIKEGDIHKSDPVRINKKHVLEGSDNLGVPPMKKPAEGEPKDTRVLKGTLVIPEWVATQKGVWNPQTDCAESKE